MKKQYIKFKEGDKKDLERACRLAEQHGYRKWYSRNAIDFEGTGILLCDEQGDYYTVIDDEDEMEWDGHTKLKDPSVTEIITGFKTEQDIETEDEYDVEEKYN